MNEPIPLLNYCTKPVVKKCDAMVTANKGVRPHPCTRDAKWYPVFVLRHKATQAVVRAALTVHLCDSCRASCKLTDLMSETGWLTIIQAFVAQGKMPPKRALTMLDWVEIDSEEAHALLHTIC
jgi:hypothetical protein